MSCQDLPSVGYGGLGLKMWEVLSVDGLKVRLYWVGLEGEATCDGCVLEFGRFRD